MTTFTEQLVTPLSYTEPSVAPLAYAEQSITAPTFVELITGVFSQTGTFTFVALFTVGGLFTVDYSYSYGAGLITFAEQSIPSPIYSEVTA